MPTPMRMHIMGAKGNTKFFEPTGSAKFLELTSPLGSQDPLGSLTEPCRLPKRQDLVSREAGTHYCYFARLS